MYIYVASQHILSTTQTTKIKQIIKSLTVRDVFIYQNCVSYKIRGDVVSTYCPIGYIILKN